MNASPQERSVGSGQARTSGIESLAGELIALVEEFEATIGEGRASPAFAERLARLRRTAERLIGL